MKVYTVPVLVCNESNEEIYATSSMAEGIVSGIAGSIAGAIVVDMIPGPAIPG